jgi:hypothetical protein
LVERCKALVVAVVLLLLSDSKQAAYTEKTQ